ncbi:ribonuclease H-like domain-containing protein [Fodinibius sp. Rm-B-1B1-1]|uniref:ribonuclease H-like domain-containing protein n=1 Tax=Fodinibius alkaliphilus TaxID=3140241 RepID=UPI003159D888
MFFVFDVETVPDFEFVRQVIDDPLEDEDELLIQASEDLARNSSGFLPPMYHRMISWVGLWIENNGVPKQKVGWNGTDEKEGLEELFDALSTYKDFGLVHHNGRGFDLPLLTYRALKYGLQMPKRLNHYEIKYRYSDDNVDLLDEFSNYGASSWPKLKHLGYLIDIPFKQTGEGNEVLKMFREDKLDEIEHYCYEDVMATYVVWLHLKYTVGDITKELFDNLNDRAMNKLKDIQGIEK